MAVPSIHVEQPNLSANSALRDQSPLRERGSKRGASLGDGHSRRSSNLSDTSLRSSAKNLFTPTAHPNSGGSHGEVSHWHSAPLAVAVLPALAGLVFHNGGIIITDLTLLALAAFALNWALRIPWQWYHLAQAEEQGLADLLEDSYHSDTIVEESEGEVQDNHDMDSKARKDASRRPTSSPLDEHPASASLRNRQSVSLLACFLFPVGMTCVLHYIRASLSRPAEGLISNTNLTIFLFAAEFRPCNEVGKMFQARTMYLQKVLNASSTKAKIAASTAITDDLPSLVRRISDLEDHVIATQTHGAAIKKSETEIINTVRKSIQPELDALNRAVRRYEKRATVQAMDTDSRLQGLEARMSDAITLAAAAERNVIQAKESNKLFSLLYEAIMWPATIAANIIAIPVHLVTLPYTTAMNYLRPKVEREKKTAGISTLVEGRNRSGDERRRRYDRGTRKPI